jgi:hypothetical protein
MPILLKVVEWALGSVDRNVGKIGTPEALHLRVEVREVAPLQQWVIAEIDAANDVVGS